MTFLHLRARACHDETRSRWRTVTFEATSPTQTSAALTFFDSIAIVFARAVAFPAERHLFTNTSHAHRARTERAQRRIAAAPRHRPRRDAVAAEGDDATAEPRGVLGVNLGKTKLTPEDNAADDYVLGVENIGEFGDYIVVNISSPNTPGLRNLQGRKHLSGLLRKVLDARDKNPGTAKTPVLVKIAPDLTDAALRDIASVVKSEKVDGVSVSNTTIARPDAIKAHAHGDEAGGLSGKPLMEPSTKVLHDLYKLTGGKITLVGCGGIASGEDAYAKIRAGASLVQLYTAFAFEGPPLIPRIKRELEECLARDGFKSVQDAIGAAHRK